jgi:hypothetical protein
MFALLSQSHCGIVVVSCHEIQSVANLVLLHLQFTQSAANFLIFGVDLVDVLEHAGDAIMHSILFPQNFEPAGVARNNLVISLL